MKLFSLSALSLLLLLASCQPEISFDNANPTNNNNNGSNVTGDFRCKINGTQFVGNQIASASRLNGIINISGQQTDGQFVTITLTDSGVHTYALTDATINAGAYAANATGGVISYTSNASDDPNLAGGSVTITSIDTVNKKISGTFSFRVFRDSDSTSKNLTEGSFTNITYGTTVGSSNSTDSMYVKVNDTLFTASAVNGIMALGKLNIVGSDAGVTRSVGLFLPETIAVGTYPIEDLISQNIYGQYNVGTTYLGSSSGTLTILEHNTTTKKIRGNFSFVAEPLPLQPGSTANLTAGYFSVKYQ